MSLHGCQPKEFNLKRTKGTTILALVNNDSIVIVADSKYTVDYSLSKDKKYESVCKIGHYNNIFYAFAGNSDFSVSVKNGPFKEIFNTHRLMQSVLKKKLPIKESYDLFSVGIKKEYLNLRKYLNNSDKIDTKFFQIIMVTYVNGKPLYKVGRFNIEGEEISKSFLSEDIIDTYNIPFIYLCGTTCHVKNYLKNDKKFLSPPINIEKKFELLINLECQAHPDAVSQPLDIIKIYKTKFVWVRKQQKCS